jgi:hypothetical protein
MMNITEQQQQFLNAFYEHSNQKAPDNIVDFHAVGRACGFNETEGLATVGLLTDGGFLEPKGPTSTYRLTPKGRNEVRQVLSGSPAPTDRPPRAIANLVSFGDDHPPQETAAQLNVGSQDCEAIAYALEQVRQHIAALEGWAGHPREHLLAIVDELEAEIQQPTPNGIRLQGLLMGLAIASHLTREDTEANHAVQVALSFLRIDVF